MKKHSADYVIGSKTTKFITCDPRDIAGWSKVKAQWALIAASTGKGPAKAVQVKPRGLTYDCGTLKLLIKVRNLTGWPSEKYRAASMAIWLPKREKRHRDRLEVAQ